MAEKKFFVDINLQGNALNNATIGSNSDMTTAGSIRFVGSRLEYYDGSSVLEVANLADISAVTGGLILQGGYDAVANSPDIADGSALKGYFWVVTTAGSFLGESVQVGDSIIAKENGAGTSIGDWLILQGNVVIATDTVDGIVRLATQAEVDAGTEGGAVVLTPATFESSQQLSDIRTDISNLESDKLARDGSQAMTGDLNLDGYNINNVEQATINSVVTNGVQLANGGTINNVPTPTSDNEAANKQYVDTAASTAQANAEATAAADATTKANAAQAAAEAYADGLAATKLDLAGGTMSGSIDMGGNQLSQVVLSLASLANPLNASGQAITSLPAPTSNDEAANKQYVDNQDALKLSLAGGTMSGNINMGLGTILNAGLQSVSLKNSLDAAENSIINLSAPTAGTDAANKTYVDSQATTAESNANSYTDSAIAQEVTDRNSAIATAKSEAIADANSYTDAGLALKLDLTGGAMTGPISMGGSNEITDLAEPSTSQSAATRNYVDTQISGTIDAVFFEGTFVAGDWTESGGVYTLSVLHGTTSTAPKVSCYVSGNLVEFAVVVIDNITIELKSNIAAPASVIVGVSK